MFTELPLDTDANEKSHTHGSYVYALKQTWKFWNDITRLKMVILK